RHAAAGGQAAVARDQAHRAVGAVVADLDVGAVAEDVLEQAELACGLVVGADLEVAVEEAVATGSGEADQTLGVAGEPLQVDPWFEVEALEPARRDQLREVAPARAVRR